MSMSTATNIHLQIQNIQVVSLKRFEAYNDIQNSFINAKIRQTIKIVFKVMFVGFLFG